MFLASQVVTLAPNKRTWGLRTIFIEEMMSGQKVAVRPLRKRKHWGFWSDHRPTLESSYQPTAAPMSSCQFSWELGKCFFVLTASIGGTLALNDWWSLMALQLNRSFTGPDCLSLNNWTLSLWPWPGDRVFDLLDGQLKKSTKWVTLSIMNWSRRNGRNRSENQQMGLKHPMSKWGLRACQDGRKCCLDDATFSYDGKKQILPWHQLVRGQKVAFVGARVERQLSPTWSTASMTSSQEWSPMMESILN